MKVTMSSCEAVQGHTHNVTFTDDANSLHELNWDLTCVRPMTNDVKKLEHPFDYQKQGHTSSRGSVSINVVKIDQTVDEAETTFERNEVGDIPILTNIRASPLLSDFNDYVKVFKGVPGSSLINV